MLTWIKNVTAPPVFEGDEEKTRVARLLNGTLWTLLGLVVVIGPPLIIFNPSASGRVTSAALSVAVFLGVAGMFLLMRRGRVRLAGVLVSSLLLAILVANTLTFGGLRSTITGGYLLVIVVAGLLLGGRGALVFGLASLLAVLGMFWAERTYETVPLRPLDPFVNLGDVIMLFGVFGLMAVLVSFALRDLTGALKRARRSEAALTESLDELKVNRDALQAHSLELERRFAQLKAASEVAHDVTAARELDELLNRAVDLIRERFNFHHVGVFLVGDMGEYAILRAASGEAGKQLLEQGVRVDVGGESAVGYVTSTGEARIMGDDVDGDETYAVPPLLRETRSEALLPLAVGDQIIGALDMKSREAEAFDEGDVAMLRTVADQLAVAIENVRLLNEMAKTVRELEVASERYTRESWRAVAQGYDRPRGYRYQRLGVEPVEEYPSEARQAWQDGRPVITTSRVEGEDGEEKGMNAAAVPIKFRDQVIGVFGLGSASRAISSEVLSLVEEVANRLALALENARLLDETQRRAQRERVVADITAKVRASSDIETIMQTAVQELGAALDADRARVQVGTAGTETSSSTKTGDN